MPAEPERPPTYPWWSSVVGLACDGRGWGLGVKRFPHVGENARARLEAWDSPACGPLALVLAARFGGGLDRLSVLPATGSTALLGGRLMRLRGSGGSHRGAPTVTSRLRGYKRSGISRFPPAHDVFDRLSLPLWCRELLGKALDSVAEEVTWEHSGTAPSPAPSSQLDTAREWCS